MKSILALLIGTALISATATQSVFAEKGSSPVAQNGCNSKLHCDCLFSDLHSARASTGRVVGNDSPSNIQAAGIPHKTKQEPKLSESGFGMRFESPVFHKELS